MVLERSFVRFVDLDVRLAFSVYFLVFLVNSYLIKPNQVFFCVPLNYGTSS